MTINIYDHVFHHELIQYQELNTIPKQLKNKVIQRITLFSFYDTIGIYPSPYLDQLRFFHPLNVQPSIRLQI
jgi:hypothetical protein